MENLGGFPIQKSFEKKKKDGEKSTLKERNVRFDIDMIEKTMSEYRKMPDSRLKPEMYNALSKSKLAEMYKNKHRRNYFTVLISACDNLLDAIKDEEKRDDYRFRLDIIKLKVQERDRQGNIPENLIDEMDRFAEKLIKEIKKI